MDKFSKFTFYYITPLALGFITGISCRDSMTLRLGRKISMSLADYYEKVDEEVDKHIKINFPEIERCLEKHKKI
jgi:hypothetical protein